MKTTGIALCLLFVSSLPSFGQDVLFSEDFEGVTLGPNVDEGVQGDAVWTNEPPAGWGVDNSQLFGADEEGVGVTEWKGWTFANKDWWVETAEDQRRSEFANGQNTVAIADPDEWDDRGGPGGQSPGGFNSFLSTPVIDISGITAGSAVLSFDSSWRPEFDDNYHQSGNLRVSFDGGEPIEMFEWLSDSSSPNYKDEAINERFTVVLNNPEGAKEMVITFGMFDAGNDWWWAIDNIEVVGFTRKVLFSEDFEGVTLGPNVDEAVQGDAVWTSAPPAGWGVDNSQLFGADEEGVGVTEWKGWTFANKDWWVEAAEDQRRSEFASGQNTVAIADPDEWDDRGGPGGQSPGGFNSFLSTPAIDISGISGGSAVLSFDSSWRPEFDDNYHQSGNLRVSFDGGDPVEVFEWLSDSSSPNYKDEAINERVTVLLNNPEGAKEMVLTFGMFDAGNDWWWAIDNIEVVAVAAGAVITRVAARPDTLTLELADAGSGIDTASLVLQIDGQAVPAAVTRPEENVIRVVHNPIPGFAAESTHSYLISGKSESGTPLSLEGSFDILPTNIFAGGFLTTRQVWAAEGGQIGGASEAEAALNGEMDLRGDITVRHPIAHFNDNSGPAFEKDIAIPYPLWAEPNELPDANIIAGERLGGGLGDHDHFATETTGEFYLREGGNILLVVSVAYGFSLEIDGAVVGEGTDRFRGNTVMEVDLAAGKHAVRLLHWADTGAAGVSLYVSRRPNIGPVEEKDVGVDDFEVLAGFNVHDVITGDTDGDGMDDFKENFFFGDLTKDGGGDQDGDGLADGQELALRSDPTIKDTDGDGLEDGDEANNLNTDPSKADSDGDSLSDGAEVNQFKTDPNKADSDDDQFDDQVEVALGSDPSNGADKPDAIVAVSSGPWSDGSTWSDGQAPRAGKNYVAVGNLTSRLLSASGNFAGDSLTLIGPGMTLDLVHTGDASANIVANNATINAKNTQGLDGVLNIRGDVLISVSDNDLTLKSRLSGVGSLTVQGGNEIESKGRMVLSGTGSTFAGSMTIIGTDVVGVTPGSLGTGSFLTASGGIDFGYDYDGPTSVFKIQGADFRLNLGGQIILSDIVGVDLSGSVLFSLLNLAGPGPYDAELLLQAFQLDQGITGEGAITLVGTAADTDSDGLLDAWEQENFGNLNAASGEDPDGDGLSNLEEQSLGKDPNTADANEGNGGGGENPAEVGFISAVVRASGEGKPIALGFPAGIAFDVEYSTDLQTWNVIATDISGAYEDRDPGRNAAPVGYYRGVAK